MSGTSNSRLDQAVKGAAPLGTSSIGVLNSRPGTPKDASNVDADRQGRSGGIQSDPLAMLPSSPPQIYLNLLILEASLRSQYLTLRDRRRQNTFFILLLIIWTAYFSWALFLAPREDGSGVGGSVYWVVETGQKVALMAGVVTGILIWGTGQWERGVRWPRRFIGVTNRGLRTMNCKVVVIKGPWWREMLGHLAFLFPFPSFFSQGAGPGEYIDFRMVEQQAGISLMEKRPSSSGGYRRHDPNHHNAISFGDGLEYIRGEDLSAGGDHIKLLLLARPFSPDFRENWELYRTEYWEKENERRALLRQKLAEVEKQRAKEEAGWLWWLVGSRSTTTTNGNGSRSFWSSRTTRRKPSAPPPIASAALLDVEKRQHVRTSSEARRVPGSGRRGESHSRNASRSSHAGSDERPVSRGSASSSSAAARRGSIVSSDGRRRSARNSISGAGLQMNPLSAAGGGGGNTSVGGGGASVTFAGSGSGAGVGAGAGSVAFQGMQAQQMLGSGVVGKRSSLAAPPLTREDSFTPPDGNA